MENNFDFFVWLFWLAGWIGGVITFLPIKTSSRIVGFIFSISLYIVLLTIYIGRVVPK